VLERYLNSTSTTRGYTSAGIHLLDGGHFLLENQPGAVAGYLGRFPGRTLT
jgi:hypothetical protein